MSRHNISMQTARSRSSARVALLGMSILFVSTYAIFGGSSHFHAEKNLNKTHQQSVRSLSESIQRQPIPESLDDGNAPSNGLVALREKLSIPREFVLEDDGEKKLISKNQFLHLHHMKTGGTSMDYYIKCAKLRLEHDQELKVPYGSIHECNRYSYEKCKEGTDKRCRDRLANAAIMSYCAPLKDLPAFSWGASTDGAGTTTPPSHGAITVLRHPVDRVWSMFRFQTKSCFKCMPLKEIYEMMDNGDLEKLEPTCYQQLQNHQVANLLSSEWFHAFDGTNNATDTVDDEAMLSEAVENMKSFFTMIGLTEQLNTTIEMAGRVFPWMQPTVDWSDKKCLLSHANSSPRNNGCGENGGHWNLPDHPDDETRAIIEAHNQLDLKLYAEAVQHFELQKQASGLIDG